MLPRRELHHGLEDWPRQYGTSVWLAHLEHAAPHLVHHVEVVVDWGLVRGHDGGLAKTNRTRCDLRYLLIDGSL